MIKKTEAQFEQIVSANCDCCGGKIDVNFGDLGDHVSIGGHKNGKLLEAIVCIKCLDEKLNFIKISEKVNTIGYC